MNEPVWAPACTTDPETFFSEDFESDAEPGTQQWFADAGRLSAPNREREVRAQLICLGCPMAEECLELGMAEEYGVWGGHTVEERQRLAKGKPIRQARVLSRSGTTRNRLVALFLSGLSIDEVASVHGTKRETVLVHLNEYIHVSSAQSGEVALAS